MRIGIITNKFAPSGGMERYAQDVVRELLRQGHEITVFTKKADPALDLVPMVELIVCPLSFLPNKIQDESFNWWLNRECPKRALDFILSCSRTDAGDVVACGGTHIGFLHDAGRTPTFFDRRAIRLETRSFERAKLIIAHSQKMAGEIEDYYGIPGEKIRVIYPPVDTERFTPVSAEKRLELKRSFGLPEDRSVFLFPSSSHERKGYPFLSSFFESTDLPVHLAVVGRPIHNEGENISYLGYSREIENCYRAADYTIMASQYEPFGLVGIESLLCGTPIVMTDETGCCEVVTSPAVTAFRKGDSADLAAKIKEIVTRGAKPLTESEVTQSLRYDPHLQTHVKLLLDAWRRRGKSPGV